MAGPAWVGNGGGRIGRGVVRVVTGELFSRRAVECHAGLISRLARGDRGGTDQARPVRLHHRRGPRVRALACACRSLGYVRRTTAVELVLPLRAGWAVRDRVGTHPAGSVLHLRWLVDPARPWVGVSPLQRAADSGSLSAWIEKRLSEEASSPVGAFLPVAKYDASGDLDGDDDPLAMLRRDIGAAKGQVLAVESAMAAADSPASAPRKDFQVARFGADPPRDLVELRTRVCVDVGSACGIPRSLLDAAAKRAKPARSVATICLDIG